LADISKHCIKINHEMQIIHKTANSVLVFWEDTEKCLEKNELIINKSFRRQT